MIGRKGSILEAVMLDDMVLDLEIIKKQTAKPIVKIVPGAGGDPSDWNTVKSNVQSIKDNVDKMSIFAPEIEGTLVADGAVHVLVQTGYGFSHMLSGRIDLSLMGAADKVKIFIDEKIRPAGGFVNYHWEEFDGAKIVLQTQKLFRLKTHEAKYGIRVSLQQTAGPVLKNFDYIFYPMRKAG